MARRTRSTDDPRRHRATTGWAKAPAPLSSSRPSPPASYAFPCRCVRDAVSARRSCSSPSLFLPPAHVPTLCSFRSNRWCSSRCNGLLVSLSSDFGFEYSASPLFLSPASLSCFVFHRLCLLRFPPISPPRRYPLSFSHSLSLSMHIS